MSTQDARAKILAALADRLHARQVTGKITRTKVALEFLCGACCAADAVGDTALFNSLKITAVMVATLSYDKTGKA
jgi:hypothetical protein